MHQEKSVWAQACVYWFALERDANLRYSARIHVYDESYFTDLDTIATNYQSQDT